MRKRILIMLMTFVLLPTLASCGVRIKDADMKAYEGFKEDNHFKTSKYSDVLDMIEDAKEGIYFIANPDNPTSLSYVEILEEIAEDKNIDIMYVDTSSDSYKDKDKEKVNKLSEKYIADSDFRNVFPVVYVVKNGNVNTVSPVFNGVSVSSRLLNLDEQQAIKGTVEQLWYD